LTLLSSPAQPSRSAVASSNFLKRLAFDSSSSASSSNSYFLAKNTPPGHELLRPLQQNLIVLKQEKYSRRRPRKSNSVLLSVVIGNVAVRVLCKGVKLIVWYRGLERLPSVIKVRPAQPAVLIRESSWPRTAPGEGLKSTARVGAENCAGG